MADSEDVTKDVTKDVLEELPERQAVIMSLIREDVTITTTEMSQKMGVVRRTIMRDLADLQQKGLLKREGGRKDGKWVLVL